MAVNGDAALAAAVSGTVVSLAAVWVDLVGSEVSIEVVSVVAALACVMESLAAAMAEEMHALAVLAALVACLRLWFGGVWSLLVSLVMLAVVVVVVIGLGVVWLWLPRHWMRNCPLSGPTLVART